MASIRAGIVLQLLAALRISAATYTNPVISGNWSDAAVVKAGDWFYSISSSFGWQPGLPIMRSTDLLHWDYIGYVYLTNSNIATGTTSAGSWGSEIQYNPVNKTFVVYTPINNRIAAYSSVKPEGPYIGPSDVGITAIDPGFFPDDDGRLYLIVASGEIWELEGDGLKKKGTAPVARGLNPGGFFEGPEIIKRNGYYFVAYSSGGTCTNENSAIQCIRAQKLTGPWAACPFNPIMNANSSTNAVFQGPAHGEPLEMPDGQWYMTYHAFEQNYVSYARFMCMEPLEWTADNWFRPKNGRIPSSTPQPAPNLPASTAQTARSDEFDSAALGKQWFFHTKPDTGGASWSLAERPGFLRIKTKGGDVGAASSLVNVFLQRISLKRFDVAARLTFDASSGNEAAGILLYKDPASHLELSTTVRGGAKCFTVTKNGVSSTPVATAPNAIGSTVYLKISVDGKENATFFYGADGTAWTPIGGSINFGKNGSPYIGWKCGEWTGGTAGLFGVQNGGAASKNADFDWFHYADPTITGVVQEPDSRNQSQSAARGLFITNKNRVFETGTIIFSAPEAGFVNISFFSISGKKVSSLSIHARAGLNSVNAKRIIEHLTGGIYCISVSAPGRTGNAAAILKPAAAVRQ